MTLYLDTSVLVTVFTREPQSHQAHIWLGKQDAEQLSISEWVTAEFSSALSIKLRSGQIDIATRSKALSDYRRYATETFKILAIPNSAFRSATNYVDQTDLGLRASDALHLAIASEYGAELCTRDVRMAQAGASLGIRTQLI